jgi:tetratricopeptide (TPR) repeat protein
MGRRRLIIPLMLLSVIVLIWQTPALLKAIPSRYLAAYLPQPVQALAEREHVEVLPTAAVQIDASSLLDGSSPPQGDDPVAGLPSPIVSTVTSEDMVAPTEIAASPTPIPSPSPSPSPTNTPIPFPPAARLSSFRHEFQGWNNCGPATLAMGLSYFDLTVTQNETASVLKPDPEDRNVSPHEMAAYVNDHTQFAAIDRTNGTLDTLRRLIANEIPVIIELGLDPPGEYRWMGWYGHYLLVVAYDDALQQLWVYDSWFGTSQVPAENADSQGRPLSYDDLATYWRQFNRNYIALYEEHQTADVAAIIGENMDDDSMWQASLSRIRDELDVEPQNAFLWFNLGTVLNALGDHEKAAAAFDQARVIGLPWRMLWYQFGPYEAYYEVGRLDDVILLADLTLKDRPYFEESYYYRGLAYAAKGDLDRAREDLGKAARFNPNFAPAVMALENVGL